MTIRQTKIKKKFLLIMWGLIVFGKVFTDAMTVAVGCASVQATMSSIETSLAYAGSIDTLPVFLAPLIAGLQITSGALPFRRTDA